MSLQNNGRPSPKLQETISPLCLIQADIKTQELTRRGYHEFKQPIQAFLKTHHTQMNALSTWGNPNQLSGLCQGQLPGPALVLSHAGRQWNGTASFAII